MLIVIDNYDSFVYNLVRYFRELGETVQVYRNDAITIDLLHHIRPKGIIISPGPKDPTDSGICEEVIREFASSIPILGVCLGHQALAHVFGATILRGEKPVHGKLSMIHHDGQGLFFGLPNPYQLTRYHSLIVDEATLPPDFEITARSEDNVIMGLRHKKLFLEGVQFHPEAVLTHFGHELLARYIHWCNEVKS